jgi:hypothetical protein
MALVGLGEGIPRISLLSFFDVDWLELLIIL